MYLISSPLIRRALRMAIAMFMAVIAYRTIGLTQGFWVPLTVCIIMQTTTGATLRKGLQRLVGTFLGIIIGSLLVMWIHESLIIDILLVLFLFLAYALKAFNLTNYGIFVVPLTIMVVFLVSAVAPQEAYHLIWARLYDTALGAIIAVLITFLIFPISLKAEVKKGKVNIINAQAQYLDAIFNLLLQVAPDSAQQAMQKRHQFELALAENRRLYSDWVYELGLNFSSKNSQLNFLTQTEKLGQFLFALHHIARQGWPSDELLLEKLISDLTEYRKILATISWSA